MSEIEISAFDKNLISARLEREESTSAFQIEEIHFEKDDELEQFGDTEINLEELEIRIEK